MDWFLYYELAQEWVENDGEAHKRSAVSRAYYAMYCTAKEELMENMAGYSPPECSSEHKYVWDSYRGDCHPRGTRAIGVLGNRLRRYRNKADYERFIEEDEFKDLVENAMDDAQDLKQHLEDLWV